MDQAWSQLSFSAKILKKYWFFVSLGHFLCFLKQNFLFLKIYLNTEIFFFDHIFENFSKFNFFFKKKFLICFFEFSTVFVFRYFSRLFPTPFTCKYCMYTHERTHSFVRAYVHTEREREGETRTHLGLSPTMTWSVFESHLLICWQWKQDLFRSCVTVENTYSTCSTTVL